MRRGVHLGPVRVRPDPLSGCMDNFGPTVNKAAPVASAANAGQVLLTDERGRVWACHCGTWGHICCVGWLATTGSGSWDARSRSSPVEHPLQDWW